VTPRDRSWGITLSWALPLLEQLLPAEVYSKLQACQPDPTLDARVAGDEGILIRDGASGKKKIQVSFPVIRRVNIQKTKKNLATGLDIKYGKRLVDISVTGDRVTAHFEDGTSESGSVIIGADGGNSQVRRWLLPEDLAAQEVLPFQFMNFSFTLPADKAVWLDKEMNHNVDVATHPKSMYMGLFQLDKPDVSKPETWIFYILSTWPIKTKEDEENSKNRLERLRAKMDNWGEPFQSVVAWLPDDVVIKPDQLRIWHPKPWDNRGGKVTLAGDAAHRLVEDESNRSDYADSPSMTFHRGQGGNLAIKDAYEFVTKMIAAKEGKLDLAQAVTEYDAGVVDRGEEVAISKAQAFAFHDYENFDNSPVMKMGIKPAGK
jgi:2-polyprenyl-6-methoxyphenol hydroxylase-like FAD-dependent oxidoreductase